ncbi:alpha/beta hydrolase-fold protein [Bisgaard Taxon 10/6]|uniref:esterase family protein n=1 Tax=Exercitatus varius TaxID=67857 RepID=UPI00294B782D|nr:alpha/beta hydrolase-fold protein [Exercitatus varius]MDG2948005.1 alpha/beta hydrolase-fold protein [Exercitatus varius]
MKKTTALLLLSITMNTIAIDSLQVKNGDFVKGRFTVPNTQPSDLTVVFPDRSTRRLLHNIAGSQEFMFKAQGDGNAQFRIRTADFAKEVKNYQLDILQHIPVEQQKSPPERQQSPLMQHLAEQLQQASNETEKQKILESFWRRRQKEGTPLVETGTRQNYQLVTFLWRSAKHNVTLWGAPSHDHEPLQRLANSDVWFKTYELRDDTLISYSFAPDIPTLPVNQREQRRALLSTLQADPLNPKTFPHDIQHADKYNYSSVLALSHAPKQPYTKPQNVPHGKLETYRFHSKLLNNSRRILVYFPPHFTPNQPDQLLLFFFDGRDYTDTVPTPRILDNMIAAQKIPPAVAVFIDNPSVESRHQELPPNSLFTRMLAKELYPWITQQLHIKTSPNRTALIGSSFGGLAASYVAAKYPELFGNVLAMSGSFWWYKPDTPSEQKNYIAHLYAVTPQRNVRFFLSAGRYETGGNDDSSILSSSRHLHDVLTAKGYVVTYREYTTDHSYFAWQGILSDGLSTLFGRK